MGLRGAILVCGIVAAHLWCAAVALFACELVFDDMHMFLATASGDGWFAAFIIITTFALVMLVPVVVVPKETFFDEPRSYDGPRRGGMWFGAVTHIICALAVSIFLLWLLTDCATYGLCCTAAGTGDHCDDCVKRRAIYPWLCVFVWAASATGITASVMGIVEVGAGA